MAASDASFLATGRFAAAFSHAGLVRCSRRATRAGNAVCTALRPSDAIGRRRHEQVSPQAVGHTVAAIFVNRVERQRPARAVVELAANSLGLANRDQKAIFRQRRQASHMSEYPRDGC